MKMFIDTANVDHIREANDLGVICGVTTNPSLIAKEGRDFVEVVKEITTIVDGPISAEVISLDHEGMVKEARELVKIHKNIVIKIPMTLEGLKAVTINPAQVLGIDDRKGDLKAGLDADIVVWDQHPFAYQAHVEQVFLGGKAMC